MVESNSIDSDADGNPDSAPDAGANARAAPSQSHDPMTPQAIEEQVASIEFASKTDVGQVRSANEDSCDTARRADGAQLLVVADGMGGHQGGATASGMAIAAILEEFESNASADIDEMLREGIESANARIFELASADADLEGMGTTVVAFVLDASHRATVAHVGDSRAYRYRRGHLEPLTTDHSVVAEMQRRGLLSADEASSHPRRNEILRSVGVLGRVEVEVASVEIAPGDRFLLCSDGLSGVLSDDEIAAVVQSRSPQEAVEALIDLANERGGPDNITVQILAMPTSQTQGDPEATAPVELSDIGIEAIENKRRERTLIHRVGIAAIVFAACAAAFLAWQLLNAASRPPPESASPPEPAPTMNTDAPRRGIPR
jgi:protein phosphatase